MLLLFTVVIALAEYNCDAQCINGSTGCFPAEGNLAIGRDVAVTSSCTDGEEFNFFSESLMCNSTLNSPSKINDDDPDTNWVSGVDTNLPLPFIIQLDFEGPVVFSRSVTTWSSRTPAAMRLERNNGSDWIPYRYYSENCMEHYGLENSLIIPNMVFNSEDPVCTDLFFQVTPGGEVEFLTSSHNGDDAYPLIFGLRIVVDNITEDLFHESISNVLSISEWVVQGSCMCNGHASTCSPLEGESLYENKVYTGCNCSHNTAGNNCEQCEPLYSNRQWLPGNETDANQCEACQCNGHTCYFDNTQMTAVCICQNNTKGDNCSLCQSTYYPGPSSPNISENYCIACNCNEAGVVDNGECSDNGTCNCKPFVTLEKCTGCRDGYWNYSEANPDVCQPCDCGEGTAVCDASTGECKCLSDEVEGDRCDFCEEGKYDLQEGCNKNCTCDPIGSRNTIQCKAIDGQCDCKDNITGTACDEVDRGYYYKSLDDITLEAEDANNSNLSVLTNLSNKDAFSGRGYLAIISGASVAFTVQVPVTSNYLIVLRYLADGVDISNVSVSINAEEYFTLTLISYETSEPNLNNFEETNSTSVFFEKDEEYEIMVSYNPSSGHEWFFDSIVLIPDVTTNSSFFESFDEIEQDMVVMMCLPFSLPAPRNDYCDKKSFQFSLELYEEVFPCSCNIGEALLLPQICSNISGECLCKDNTVPDCSECLPGFYATNDTECQVCGCNYPEASVSELCNGTTGQCNCIENAIGLQCMDCPDTHYNTTGSGQDYCTECFCFGHSTSCVGDNEGYNLTAVEDSTSEMFNNGWTEVEITFISGFVSTDGLSYSVESDEAFFIAPDSYHHDFKLSYGHSLTFVFELDDEAELNDNRYAMISNSELSLFSLFESPIIEGLEYSFTIPFLESYWRVSNSSGRVATLGELIDVLANVTDFRFTAKFTNNIGEFNLLSLVRWEYLSIEPTEDSVSLTVEACYCPSEYTGQFCEECAEGYYRMRNSLVADCIECECNNRSDSCTTPTGVCVNCTGNWQGDHCDECPFDYYPDPNGTDCIPCASGYRGEQCDQCDNGYYNNSGSCELCNCNGNINTSIDPFCNPMTGECLNCTNNTQGFNCDICATGYYGADSTSCQICNCNYERTLPGICNSTTGECLCLGNSNSCTLDNNYTLTAVETDFASLFAASIGNNCNNFGDWIFDGISILCSDEYGNGMHYYVIGQSAIMIAPGSYHGDFTLSYRQSLTIEFVLNFTPLISYNYIRISNSDLILYSPFPSYSKENMTYTFEVPFLESYWRVGSLNGRVASVGELIDVLANVTDFRFTGNLTDDMSKLHTLSSVRWEYLGKELNLECPPGFYENPTDDETCTRCPCPTANNSHASSCYVDTDDLITCNNCDDGHRGRYCQECSEGYYGDPLAGECLKCDCGSNYDITSCDNMTGVCSECVNNITYGVVCDSCVDGYYGDPAANISCTLCSHCSINGTTPEICEMRFGICFCKPNVVGENCSMCEEGMFGAPDLGIPCEPCPCVNIDDPICHLNSDDLVSVICDNCGPAYDGDLCQNCANGYYRNELNTCIPCDCNGNVDPSLGLVCHPNNGTCINCLNNTSGPNCDQCVVGYYGDVLNGVPCEECDCNRNGTTDAVCDSETGDCFCEPLTNATSRCDSCNPGYWGSASTECRPCDCCSNGSKSIECNQTNGQCLCQPGVEGTQCCECEVGYYNLTSSGCTACECGELAISAACNSTGHCDCQQGGVGMKCDECVSFGYIGNAPNCTRCHDCFFLWNDILVKLNRDVNALLARIQLVLDFYSLHTVESINSAITTIENTLSSTNQTLGMLSVNTELLNTIETNLNEVNTMYDLLRRDLDNLMMRFTLAEEQLNNITTFLSQMGNNLQDSEELFNNITSLSTTIQTLKSQAVFSYETLKQNQVEMMALHAITGSLLKNVSAGDEALSMALNVSKFSIQLEQMAESVESELSTVNKALSVAEKRVSDFKSGLFEATLDTEELMEDLQMLDYALAAFNLQLMSISVLSGELENSTASVRKQADSVYSDIKAIMKLSSDTFKAAETLMTQIDQSQKYASAVASNLSTAQDQAAQLSQVEAPSTVKAAEVADEINTTVIPQEEIDEVLGDATESAIKAQEYLNRATNANQEVSNLEEAAHSIESDAINVNDTLKNIDEKLTDVSRDNEKIDDFLNKVETDLSHSNYKSYQNTVDEIDSQVESGEHRLDLVKARAEEAEEDSKTIQDSVVDESVIIQSEAADLDQLVKNATDKYNATSKTLERANAARKSSNQSNTEATKSSPSLADLSELLSMYKKKLKDVNDAKMKIASLNEELDSLMSTFDEVSTKYENCYKTP